MHVAFHPLHTNINIDSTALLTYLLPIYDRFFFPSRATICFILFRWGGKQRGSSFDGKWSPLPRNYITGGLVVVGLLKISKLLSWKFHPYPFGKPPL